ncbi:MAG: DUF5673 domain-containing protein [Cyanobacteriota bacterium]
MSGIEALAAIVQTYGLIKQLMKGLFDINKFLLFNLYFVFAYWSFAIYLLLLGMSRLEFRENGICSSFTLIKWNRVLSYKWEGKNGKTLTIRTQPIFSLFGNRDCSLSIPATKKDAVEQILIQHLSGEREDRPYEAS